MKETYTDMHIGLQTHMYIYIKKFGSDFEEVQAPLQSYGQWQNYHAAVPCSAGRGREDLLAAQNPSRNII